MKGPGEVLLVSCYELGHQPFSLASPLAFLAEAGFQPRAIDTFVEPLDDQAVRAARLVAISTPMHTALRLANGVARTVRELNPRAHINFYGLYACLNAEYLFEANLADSVIGGEFEQPLVRLANALTRPALSPSARDRERLVVEPTQIKGVHFQGQDAPRHIERQTWPLPRRETLPDLARYAHFVRDGEAVPTGYVEATRGCKHTCSHCPITPVYQGRFFAIPREIVLADIRAQVGAGARHITFGDPDFLNGPTHSLRIVREMHQDFPDLTFDATIKIEHILQHAELLPDLKQLGCAFAVSAVESLSDTVLAHLRKGHTATDVARALDLMTGAGIPLRPSLLAFTPWTTLDDYIELLHFVQVRGLVDSVDPVQYAIRLLIPPGSAVLDDSGVAEWLGELDAPALSYRWTHPDPRMDALHARVSEIVERGELEERTVWETFAAITSAAHRSAGREPLLEPLVATSQRWPPPRLTESWFC